ncbi:MAG TPA: cell surface protein [Candidatus Paceibacterota bacterium]|nr:cell surface protein [Verrucomicrobiota bacterium]HRZ47291.1 cell surface protein [Candidatus Paceibacterota bacterium]
MQSEPEPRVGVLGLGLMGAARALAGLLGLACGFSGVSARAADGASAAPLSLSPAVLLADRAGQSLYVACTGANRVLVVSQSSGKVMRAIPMPARPSGLAISRDGDRLFVTCAAPESIVCAVDPASGAILQSFPAGHTATAPVLAADGRTLFLCHRFQDEVGFLDLGTGRIDRRVRVAREPVAAVVTPDGRYLLVANHLHNGRADSAEAAAVVSVIDIASARVIRELRLPGGSGVLADIGISPDGRYAAVTHLLARFYLPTTQVHQGWMNTNALTLIDLSALEIVNTVLLDSVDRGSANPWGIAWTADGETLVVAHAGAHELSLIDFQGLLKKLPARRTDSAGSDAADPETAASKESIPSDLAFLTGLRRRVPLPPGDLGPRGVAAVGRRIWTANYFSDTLTCIDLSAPGQSAGSIALGPKAEMGPIRRGEFFFHSASICFQGWQSCASCHPGDGRADALNWDLLNDGLGNPKNNRSLLLTHRMQPSMSMGVRPTAEAAVRAGIQHILFTVQPETVADAIDEYLKSLEPVPSPRLIQGRLSPAAERGRRLFEDVRVGCAECHRGGQFTDGKPHDVGTRAELDPPEDRFFTPTLIEVWRTAPYLHDGSAPTLEDVLDGRNAGDLHGRTLHLTPDRIDDLAEYVLSL